MLYKVLRPFIVIITKLFIRPKYIGKNNIPKNGRIILAGNHIGILDAFLIITATKRQVHFLAKKELWKGFKRVIFSNMGLIPVDRKNKDHNSLVLAEEYLNNDNVIGIFPEGTTEKGRGLLDFKIGAVKMAYDTSSLIIPFVINGKYKIFSKVKVIFEKSITVNSSDLDKENKKLRSKIINMLKEN